MGKSGVQKKASNKHKYNFQNEPTNLVGLTTPQNSSQFRKKKSVGEIRIQKNPRNV